jgi:hypothetical protein
MAAMTPARKRIAIAVVVLGGALIAERVIELSGADEPVVEAAAPRRVRSAAAAAEGQGGDTALRLDRLDDRQRTLLASAQSAKAVQPPLFKEVDWTPPAPREPSTPPPKPVAPPFPYAYMGKLLEDGVTTAFFTKGNRVIPVKAGDTVDAVFRVDQMTSQQMKLTYLPLNETLVLALGGPR